MLELAQNTEQLKKIILSDIRKDLDIYYEYYWIDCKNNIFCLEIRKMIYLIGEPYIYNDEILWCTILDPYENDDEKYQLENWQFAENFPLQVTTDLKEILEVHPIS